MNAPNPQIILPFLKWAGGKRWLVNQHKELFPKTYERYIEPFVGSGAVYFHLQPKRAIIADANYELIETYQAIKQDWQGVWNTLKCYQELHNENFYYVIRSKSFRNSQKRAAKFIYLNRTCWNGLYRVNLAGKFNVPVGTKSSVIMNTDDFAAVAGQLKNTIVRANDFARTIGQSRKNDFLFIDPPYTVKHNFNGFVKYNDHIFSWKDQIRLRDAIRNAVDRGVKVLVTNADHESVRDLYNGMGKFISLDRSSVISGNPEGRGQFSELVIKCF